MPGISTSVEVVRVLPRLARWPTMAKRCASSRMLLDEMQPGMLRRQLQRLPLGLEDQLLQPRLALRPLGHADQRDVVQAELGEPRARRVHLPAAAVDEDQVGNLALPGRYPP